LRAPFDTWRITGDFSSEAALMMAWSCSMLLKLNAGIAYPPLMALANISRVLTKPKSL